MLHKHDFLETIARKRNYLRFSQVFSVLLKVIFKVAPCVVLKDLEVVTSLLIMISLPDLFVDPRSRANCLLMSTTYICLHDRKKRFNSHCPVLMQP